MTNRHTLFMISALIIFVLSACQPQIDLEPAQQGGEREMVTAVPSSTPSLEAIIETPILEAVTKTAAPELIEEIVMPEEPAAQPPEPIDAEPKRESDEPTPEAAFPSVVQDWIDHAKNDLALRESIPSEEITLLSFESKVWPDSSLGCPQPGWNYLQVLTEGYLIRLSIGDKVYNYHGGGNRDPFLCQQAGQGVSGTKRAPLDSKLTPTKSVPPPKK